MKPPLIVQGMHGMGDCLHQRAVVRQLMRESDVTLETSWASMYHDLLAEGLKVTNKASGLRTQAKNAARASEAALFSPHHRFARPGLHVSYQGSKISQTKSKTVLEAMCNATGTSYADADFTLPVPDAWTEAMLCKMAGAGVFENSAAMAKPWMFFRPLVSRHEWPGGTQRNADPEQYSALYANIRDRFFTISVADVVPGREWLVDADTKADLSFHAGELVFEDIAALAKKAALVFTSSGFAAILGPAVGTPTISIIGGYEGVGCHDSGAKFAPYLAIGPERGCICWRSNCGRICSKSLNMDAARTAMMNFVREKACPAII